jgi:hypothetical protein
MTTTVKKTGSLIAATTEWFFEQRGLPIDRSG